MGTNKHPRLRWQPAEITIGDSVIPLAVARTDTRETLALSVHPSGDVSVIAPKGERLKRIVELVSCKGEWIVKQREYFRQLHRSWPRQFISGESYYYLGRQYRLKVKRSRSKSVTARTQMLGGRLEITVPRDVAKAQQPDFVRQQLVAWYQTRAASQLAVVASRFCQTIGIETPPILIRDFARRWGSANDNGRLAFNWRIVMAPRPLIAYVAAHEVCHLIHNDHSADFWRLLERMMPDYESRRIQLAIEGAKFQL